MYFPKGAKYYFLTPSIKEGFGGLTNAMLKRGRLFFEKENIKVDILTFNFNPDYVAVRKYLTETNKVNEGITVLNMYEFYSASINPDWDENKVYHTLEEDGCSIDPVEGKNAYRFYKNGLYVMYKSFEGVGGTLKFIDYFNEHRSRTKREEYDQSGHLRKVTYMDLALNVPRQELFFTSAGRCFISKWYKLKNDKSVVERIHWFGHKGEVKTVFKSDIEMQRFWLNSLIENEKIPLFMIVDGRAMDSLVLSLNQENVYKIFVKHSIHLRPPFDPYSVLRLGNRAVFSNVEKADAIVLLTEAQKKDVEVRFGERNNYFTIPHSHTRAESFPEFNKRNLKKAVVVARYHEEKQLDHIIKAFKQVVKKVPEASLDLYGFGQEEKKLAGLIQELNLSSNVLIKGSTEQPEEVFRNAAFSILTSKYEGFGLVILESLAQGCPVISYDIKYGPSDMIRNNENGALVPNGDVEKLADSMIEFFSDPKRLEELSKAAYESSSNFSEALFMERWGNLFYKVLEQRPMRNTIENLEFRLNYSDWTNKEQGIYKIEGRLILEGDYPEESLSDCAIMWKIQKRDTKEAIYRDAGTIERDSQNNWMIKTEFPLFSLNSQSCLVKGIWDISIVLKWNNSYLEKRIGYNKSKTAETKKSLIKTSTGLVIHPYYTNPYGNLSFNIKEKSLKDTVHKLPMNPPSILKRIYNKVSK